MSCTSLGPGTRQQHRWSLQACRSSRQATVVFRGTDRHALGGPERFLLIWAWPASAAVPTRPPMGGCQACQREGRCSRGQPLGRLRRRWRGWRSKRRRRRLEREVGRLFNQPHFARQRLGSRAATARPRCSRADRPACEGGPASGRFAFPQHFVRLGLGHLRGTELRDERTVFDADEAVEDVRTESASAEPIPVVGKVV